MVESNPGYPYRRIPCPFGAGNFQINIGFASHFISNSSNTSYSQYPSSTTLPPYPTSLHSFPSNNQGISLIQNQFNVQHNQVPQNVYPRLNNYAPFSYINAGNSTSDYMQRVTITKWCTKVIILFFLFSSSSI